MTLEKINKEWCESFTEALTKQNAAIVFALGITAEGQIRNCMTTDISKENLKAALVEILISLDATKWPQHEISDHPFLKGVTVMKMKRK